LVNRHVLWRLHDAPKAVLLAQADGEVSDVRS
jgi:hypothetical protein